MKEYDIIVIGAGAGVKIATPAAKMGLKVALIEKGPLGGTCLNRGCIPSKMLIHPADLVRTIKEAKRFGINCTGEIEIDWKSLVEQTSAEVDKDAISIEPGVENDPNRDWYKEEAYFVSNKVVQVGEEQITAPEIFIVAGTRPFVPPIEGLKDTPYMTNVEALRLTKKPKKLIVLGGGYIGSELAHFYGGLGVEVEILQRDNRLLKYEDSEISAEFTRVFANEYKVRFNTNTKKVSYKDGMFSLEIEENGEAKTITSDQLLVATGRIPNSDILKLTENTDIELNKRGYIQANEFFETSVEGVYSFGDIIGKFAFRHSANHEGERLFKNLFGKEPQKPMNYHAMPHAVFSYPQVAGVGKTEDQLKEEGADYAVGKRNYINSGMGMALRSDHGFIKILADKKSKEILGAHIVGHEASILIHELIYAVRNHATTDDILDTVHIHPALSELIPKAVNDIVWD